MYRKQFLLTKERTFKFNWDKKQIGNYNLFHHPDLEYAFVKKNHIDLHLLGSLYDYENPKKNNKCIIEDLSGSESLADLFLNVSKYSGEFVMILKLNDELVIFNDACAQSEIYYEDNYSCFGSQPKIIAEVIDIIPHDDLDAIDFYSSSIFNWKKLFIGESTHVKNIKHLRPNHYINITKKNISRFYPIQMIFERPLDEVAKKATIMIKGYVKAISLRHKISIAVTGGYDSRVLFLASLETKSEYFISKHHHMTDNHHDIKIPKLLTSYYNKKFVVVPDSKKNDFNNEYINSIDFPRYLKIADKFKNQVLINGNISEIARNYFGYHKYVSSKDLSFLNGYSTHKYPSKQYDIYLNSNKKHFENFGYDILDMFYWEEKMAIWAAKTKTEINALGSTTVSPYNSRDLLTLLLSVKRKYRDSHYNKLYDKMIFYLSGNNDKVQKLAVNPCMKQSVIRLMKQFKIYDMYREIGLRTRKLKV